MLGVEGMVGAVDGSLDVAQHRVHPRQVGVLATARSPARHEGRLARRPAASLAAAALPAPIGVIDLHDALQRDAFVALAHGLHELVLELLGGILADTELAGQFQS